MLNLEDDEKVLLEMSYYIFKTGGFDPLVFANDEKDKHTDFLRKNLVFLEAISFFNSLGIYIDFEKKMYSSEVNRIFNYINDDYFQYWYYDILMIDYSNFDVLKKTDFSHPLLRLYAFIQNGTPVDKNDISNIFNKELSSNDITQLKKIFKEKTFSVLETRKDNSYVLKREDL